MNRFYIVFIFFLMPLFLCVGNNRALANAKFKVLVVMSYEENYPWVKEIRSGIESVLLNKAEIKYFYLNTKTHGELAASKAKEAFDLYKKYSPDGVIACDDDAQSLFVVPFLKNKVKTPVIFCGVNESPEKYGYPATNVSGILERELFKESLYLAKGLDPRFKKFAFIGKKDPATKAIVKQIEREKKNYPIKLSKVVLVETYEEAIAAARGLKKQSDLLLHVTLEGLKDKTGNIYNDQQVIWALVKEYGKPLVGSAGARIESGALCAVMVTGDELGAVSGEMLLKAMTGTSVSKIPITVNQFGKRMINADMILYYKLKPVPEAIRGGEIVPLKQQ